MIIQNFYSQLLKVHSIQNLSSNTIPFTFFFAIIFPEVPMWSTHLRHPKVMIPQKMIAEGC